MKWVNRTQSIIITGNTAGEFQDRLNKSLDELARKGYKHELPCCDWFYETLERGGLVLNEEETTAEKDIRPL